MKVSFLIPAYNAGTTLSRAVDSILNQHPSDLDYEIIIADDGSNDNTKEIAKKYADEYENIKYFFKENEGLSTTRNFLAAQASGEYFIYVDSDDYVSETLLQDIQGCVKADCDLIKWNTYIEDEYLKEISVPENKIVGIMTGEEAFNKLYGIDPLLCGVWLYAIRKDRIMQFPDGRYHEDFAVMPLILLSSKKVAVLPDREYHYIQTAYSITRGNDEDKIKKRLNDMLASFDNLVATANKMELDKKTKENLAIYGTYSLIAARKDLKKHELLDKFYKDELKKRNIGKNIKARNPKALIKKVLISTSYKGKKAKHE